MLTFDVDFRYGNVAAIIFGLRGVLFCFVVAQDDVRKNDGRA
jgi:hypothetical protein